MSKTVEQKAETDEIASIIFNGYFSNDVETKEQADYAIEKIEIALERLKKYRDTLTE